jgi:hypothetical protein
LRVGVWNVIGTLKLDADGKVITIGSTLILRLACVPIPLIERHELNRFAGSADQNVRGHAQVRDVNEIRMGARVELIAKELLNVCAAKIAWRQANAMNNKEVNFRGRRRARVLVR